jgi:hypothetical protein
MPNNDPDRRDHRAEFGRQPTWRLQRKKQDEAAKRAYREAPEKCDECGSTRVIGDDEIVCSNCGATIEVNNNE